MPNMPGAADGADAGRLTGIHQPHYLPWLRYFEKIARCGVFIVLDNIQYSKNGWQNRNWIKTAQGPALLSVPVHAELGARILDVRIDNRRPWRRKHWRAIEQSYAHARYFDVYAPALEAFYRREWLLLHELNRAMLEYFLEALGVRTPIRYASELDVPGTATDRLINLIRAVDGTAYYSGAYALEAYLDAAALEAAGIALVLQQWTPPHYPQLHGAFAPDLSIIDLLMNRGPRSLETLMHGAADQA